MSIDGGYPRAITIIVPDTISEGEIGDFVSNEVVSILNNIGTANIHRRSVSLRFLKERFVLLQFESHTGIRLEDGQRERFEVAKNSIVSSAENESQRESREAETVSSSTSNRKKQNKMA